MSLASHGNSDHSQRTFGWELTAAEVTWLRDRVEERLLSLENPQSGKATGSSRTESKLETAEVLAPKSET